MRERNREEEDSIETRNEKVRKTRLTDKRNDDHIIYQKRLPIPQTLHQESTPWNPNEIPQRPSETNGGLPRSRDLIIVDGRVEVAEDSTVLLERVEGST